MLTDKHLPQLASLLRDWLPKQRWFAGKARQIAGVEVANLPIALEAEQAGELVLLRATVRFADGTPDSYLLPILATDGSQTMGGASDLPLIGQMAGGGSIFDAAALPTLVRGLVALMAEGMAGERAAQAAPGRIKPWSGKSLRQVLQGNLGELPVKLASGEQSNSCAIFGDQMILKLFRRLEAGVNPDVEIGRRLAELGAFRNVPEMLGALDFESSDGPSTSLAVLHRFVPGGQDAWALTLEQVNDYLASPPQSPLARSDSSLWQLREASQPAPGFFDAIKRLGRRTAELHLTLATPTDDPAFSVEPITAEYRQSLRDGMRALADRTLKLLAERKLHLPGAAAAQAERLLSRKDALLGRFDAVVDPTIDGQRIRCHGDYHLGQVLYANGDFMILDFEGEPARTLAERRAKKSPLVDVAGMLRSFHYARSQALFARRAKGSGGNGGKEHEVADRWYLSACAAFLRGYRSAAEHATYLPSTDAACDRLLSALVLEKAVYELGYELNNRPDWVEAPLDGLLALVG